MSEELMDQLNKILMHELPPTVRLHKVTLDHFKSVEHGEVVFDCAKHIVPAGTKSDILGIYGQNGSGKTAFIEALGILKHVMSGKPVPDAYTDCISFGHESARLSFLFDLQYPAGDITKEPPEIDDTVVVETRKLEYSFYITTALKKENKRNSISDIDNSGDIYIGDDNFERRIVVFNEVLRTGGIILGKKRIMHTICDTSSDETPFTMPTKLSDLYAPSPKLELSLLIAKNTASQNSSSFIFSTDNICLMRNESGYPYTEMIKEMSMFASMYLFVIDTKSSGFIRLNAFLPLYTAFGSIPLKMYSQMLVSNAGYKHIKSHIDSVSMVLSQMVPGLSLAIKDCGDTKLKNGMDAKYAEPVAIRNGVEMPLRYESDGVRKLISVMSLIITAYNQKSTTIAIDEFDAGIFEYLLGEILTIFQETGKGQFIFTSHNLRPLEVIDKRFLYFTTTNPENRYIRLKGIGNTNNLRSTYFREIIVGEQDEEIYQSTKKYKIVSAFKKAEVDEDA